MRCVCVCVCAGVRVCVCVCVCAGVRACVDKAFLNQIAVSISQLMRLCALAELCPAHCRRH